MQTQECWEKTSNSKSFSTSSTSTDNNIISALEAKKNTDSKISPVKFAKTCTDYVKKRKKLKFNNCFFFFCISGEEKKSYTFKK